MSIKQLNLKQEDAEVLYDVYERTLATLTEAEGVLWSLPKTPEREDYIRAYIGVIADVAGKLRAPVVLQYPQLDTHVPDESSDLLLEPHEQEAVNNLTPDQVQRIDAALLADCACSWRKVARVVGSAMMELSKELPGIPDSYYATRVVSLVDQGLLESQGNLEHMRYSEVRLTDPGTASIGSVDN